MQILQILTATVSVIDQNEKRKEVGEESYEV